MKPDGAIAELDQILDGEKQAILDGSYIELPKLMPRKEALMTVLATTTHPRQPALAEKVLRNQKLLGLALEGVRAAQGQVAAIKRQENGFQTYNEAGAREQVGGETGIIERKL